MRVFYLNDGKPCYYDGEKTHHFESKHILDYKETCNQIARNQDWKNSGQSAMFQGRASQGGEMGQLKVTGISGYDDNSFLYSTVTGVTSSVILKNIEDGSESLLLHENGRAFEGITYFPDCGKIIGSLVDGYLTQSVCTYAVADNLLLTLTDGDTMDIGGYFSPDTKIIYTCIANGRDNENNIAARDCAVIYSLKGGDCVEIKRVQDSDLLMPKEDNSGNLYYIQKPYKTNKKKSSGIADVLLMPFRLIYGFFRVLFFLSKVSVKKKKKDDSKLSSGDNPAVSENIDNKLEMYGYTIDMKEQEPKNGKKGEKSENGGEGYAPTSWQLCRLDKSGNSVVLATKVLSYDVDINTGDIVYTNGKGVYLLQGEEKPKLLFKDKLVTAIALQKQKNSAKDLFFV